MAAGTIDTPHGVQKEDEKSPQGDELKAPFGELVVTGRRQLAARADCGRTLARSHDYFDALLVGTEVGVLVNNTRKRWHLFRIVVSSMALGANGGEPLP